MKALLRLWLAAHHFSSVDEVLQGGIPRQQEQASAEH